MSNSMIRGAGTKFPQRASGRGPPSLRGELNNGSRRDHYYTGQGASGHAGITQPQHGQPFDVSSARSPYTNTNSNSNIRSYAPSRNSPMAQPTMDQSQGLPSDEETARFIAEGWQDVVAEMRHVQNNEGPQYYREKVPKPFVHGFEPVDLHKWYSQRLERLKRSQ